MTVPVPCLVVSLVTVARVSPHQLFIVLFLSSGKSLNGIMKASIFVFALALMVVSELKLLRLMIRRKAPQPLSTARAEQPYTPRK